MIRIRTLTTMARLAHGNPRTTLAALVAIALGAFGLAVVGAVWLIVFPEPWKWCLIAAALLAAFLWISKRA
jgi:hypothetical protein